MPTGRIDSAGSAWRTSLQEFGALLGDRRKHVLGLNQAEMAARVGLDQSRISRIEAGARPRDKVTALAIADAYDLPARQRRDWLELLFGDALYFHPAEPTADSKGFLERAYELIERIRFLDRGTTPDFLAKPPAPLTSPAVTPSSITAEELNATICWLMAEPPRLYRSHLLVELAPAVMHYLNVRGRHRQRLALALAAAEAARANERRMVEGWLRSDAIPWTLMEHLHDPVAARPHLERGLALARELNDNDMEALAAAFLARSYFITADTRQSSAFLARARHIDSAPGIRTRIEWIAGDFAMRRKRYDHAVQQYRLAEAYDLEQNDGYHVAVTPLLRLGDLYLGLRETASAREVFNTVLSDMQPAPVGGRLAYTLFGLARTARIEQAYDGAREQAERALSALATSDDNPQFQQIIDRFISRLPS